MAQTGLNRNSQPPTSYAPPPPRPVEIKGDPEKASRTVHIQNLEPHVRSHEKCASEELGGTSLLRSPNTSGHHLLVAQLLLWLSVRASSVSPDRSQLFLRR